MQVSTRIATRKGESQLTAWTFRLPSFLFLFRLFMASVVLASILYMSSDLRNITNAIVVLGIGSDPSTSE